MPGLFSLFYGVYFVRDWFKAVTLPRLTPPMVPSVVRPHQAFRSSTYVIFDFFGFFLSRLIRLLLFRYAASGGSRAYFLFSLALPVEGGRRWDATVVLGTP